MELTRTASKKRTEYWCCECEPAAASIPVTEDFCPYCGNSMPQQVRTQIYRQVSRQILSRFLKKLWWKIERIFSFLFYLLERYWPQLVVVLCLIGVIAAGVWVVGKLPAVFEAIGDFFENTFSGPLEFFRDLLPEKAEEVVPSVPKEQEPFTLQKVWDFIKGIFTGIGAFFGKLWDILVWIWDALVWLWNAIVWLVKLIIGLAIMVFALIVEVFKLLFKVIKFLFSLL